MIQLSLEPEAPSVSMLSRSEHLRLREKAILEFTDSAGNGYLIEYDKYHGYSTIFIEPDGDYWSVGTYFDELYEVLRDALEDFDDRHPRYAPDYSWHRDLREAADGALEASVKHIERAYLPKLTASFPPKRSLFAPEPTATSSRELEVAVGSEADELRNLEASVAHRGAILDRLKGSSGLVYLVQRTDLNLFRFVVLEPGKEPRYATTQTTELRQVYKFIQQDAKSYYEHQRWFPMGQDLEDFLSRPEEDAEAYLVLKKIRQAFPELNGSNRRPEEYLAIARGISSIFGA